MLTYTIIENTKQCPVSKQMLPEMLRMQLSASRRARRDATLRLVGPPGQAGPVVNIIWLLGRKGFTVWCESQIEYYRERVSCDAISRDAHTASSRPTIPLNALSQMILRNAVYEPKVAGVRRGILLARC